MTAHRNSIIERIQLLDGIAKSLKVAVSLIIQFVFLIHTSHAQNNWDQIIKTVSSTRSGFPLDGRGSSDGFGFSVAIDGNYAAVGIPFEDEDSKNLNTIADAGSVAIFENNNGTWKIVKKIVPFDRGANDQFGWSVAISGNTLVVGAWQEDENSSGLNTLAEAGSAYIFRKDQGGLNNWGQVRKIVAEDRAGNDKFGNAVAISNNTVVVGAYLEDENATGISTLSEAGSTYIFSKDQGGTDNWGQVKKIVAADRNSGDWFGGSVAISGSFVIVGASQEDQNAAGTNTLDLSGSAYIFSKDLGGTNNWGQVKKIVASDRSIGDEFGFNVAISGNIAVIGAWQEDQDGTGGGTLSNSGSAYIFSKDQGGTDNWGQVKKIVASDRESSDQYGYRVGISGNTVVVGTLFEDHDAAGLNSLSDAGSAYIYSKDQGGTDNWGQVKKIVAADRASTDYFGRSVAISGSTVIVGANQEDENAAGNSTISNAGSAYIFNKDEGGLDGWGQFGKIILLRDVDNQRYGSNVAIDGDYAIVGASGDGTDVNGVNYSSEAGAAFILKKNNGVWQEVKKIVAADRAQNDFFGSSVAISGTTVVIGAYQEDEDATGSNTLSNAGSSYIFSKDQGGIDNWGLVKKLVASDRAANDKFGNSVAISGSTVVIGAVEEDDDATGGNALTNTGSAYVFNKDQGGTENWGQVKKLVASDREAYDSFGNSVAISGQNILIGAPYDEASNLGYGYFAGTAYLFNEDFGGIGNWGQVKKIIPDTRKPDAHFGKVVAISGNYLVVGAPQENDSFLTFAGAVHIYSKDAGGLNNWGQIKRLLASDKSDRDIFGSSIAISNTNLIVGAPNEDEDSNSGNTLSGSGSAYIFTKDQGGLDNWGQVNKIVATDRALEDRFGNSVGISGNMVLVSAYQEDEDASGINSLQNAGSAYFFDQVASPAITTTSSLTSFSACSGSASSEQTFTVSGSDLTADISVTSPTGFEVSTSSGSGFGASVTLTQSGGSVASTTIYVRMASSATGTPSGNITCSSTGATDQTVAVSGTVNALPTVTFTSTLSQIDLDAGVQTGISGGSPSGVVQSTTDNIIIDNVSFADGGVATGHIDFDVFQGNSSTTSSDFSVSVSGGNTTNFPSVTYDQTNSTATLTGGPNIITIIHTATNRRLYLPVTFNMISGQSLGTRHLHPTAKEDFNGTAPSRAATGSFTFGQYYETTGVYAGPGVTDRGGSFFFDPASAGLGTHTITYTFENANGCINSATDEIEVIPSCDIAITSATPTDESCPGTNDGQIAVVATCNTCTSIEYSIDDFATAANTTGTFTGLADGTYTVKVRDSGDIGCNATLSNVLVAAGVDNTPPVAVCPAIQDTLYLDAAGTVTLAANSIGDGSSTDNCGTVTETNPQVNFTCANLGENTVVLTADDGNGNTDIVNCIVVVLDTISPVISCPADITVKTGTSAGINEIANYPLSSDLTDQTGNNTNALLYNNPPLPTGGQLCLNGESFQNVLVDIPSMDINNVSVKVDFNASQYAPSFRNDGAVLTFGHAYRWLGIHIRKSDGRIGILYNNNNVLYSNVDLNLNQWYTAELRFTNGIAELKLDGVIIQTENLPSLNTNNNKNIFSGDAGGGYFTGCLKNIIVGSVGAPAPICGALTELTEPTVTDNCSGALVTTNDAPTTFPLGSTTVNWTSTDGSGNSTTCTQVVTVIYPDINIQGNSTDIASGDLIPSAADDTDFGLTDTETPIEKTFTIQNLGTDTLKLSATSQVVISGSSEFTVLTQPSASSILSGGSDLTFVIKYTPTTAGTHTASVSIASDDCDEGSYTFTITGSAVLACDIAITSATPTDETCPGADNGEISVIATCTTCTNIEYSIDDFATAANTTGTFTGLADGTYTVKVRDSADIGCNATLSNVLVAAGVDNTSPVLVGCPATATFTLDLCNEKTINADSLGITATDNCSTPTITLSQYSFSSSGTYDITVTASDGASLTSTCLVSVTIEENPNFFTISLTDDNIDACVDGNFTFTAASLLSNDNTSNSSTLEVQEVTLTNPADGTLTNDGNGNFTFTPANGVTGNVALTYLAKVAGEDLYFEPNGHYYEFIAADGISWTDAKAAAEARTLFGQTGYLATITSVEENGFVYSKLQGEGWLGGQEIGGVNSGDWRWVTGPEALEDNGNGLKFWDGNVGGVAIPGVYQNWISGEPNNWNNNESYLHMRTSGQWNDFPLLSYTNQADRINGYVVEYGGIACTPNFTATANITINVQLKPSIANIATQFNTCPSNVFDLGNLSITDDNSVPETITTFHGQKPTSATDLTNQLASLVITTDQKVYVMVANATTACYDVDSFMVDITLCVPEMDVFGNTVEIINGDNTPDTADDTDFGSHDVSAANVVKTFTIENKGTADLTLSGNPMVTLSGSSDFSVSAQPAAASISPAGSLTFGITFNPTSVGTAAATVSIANDDADENPYTFDISGTVTCDLAVTSATPTDVNCPGADDGTITVLATCTTCTSIEYSIDDFATSNTTGVFSDLPDGAYTVKVRDSGDAGCTASQTDVIVAPGVDNIAPVLSCPATKEIALNFCGETVLTAEMLDVTAIDNCIVNPTFSLSQTNFSGVGTSTVTVYATDGTSQSSCDVEVSFIEQTVSLTNNGPVCKGDSITFTATPMSNNLGYAFFKQQKGGSSPTTINSVSFYNSSNTYKTADIADSDIWLVLVSDGSGCTVYDTNLVRVNPLPTVSLTLNPTQFSLYDGIQTGLSGGSPAAGGATLDNININNVALAGGGTATGYVRFNSFVSGQTSPDFSVSVSGGNTTDFPPLTYNQANSTATISGGPNIISIVSSTSNRRLYIQFSQNIQPGVTVTRNLQGNSKEDHNGALPSRAASGSVSTAPYTQNNGIYSGAGVTDQGGTFDFDPSMAGEGTHVITYTYSNANGCTDSATANLEVIIPPCGVDIDLATPTAESCIGENDGSITVTASCSTCSGGTSDIRYSLDSLDFSNTTGVFENLTPGTYSVYVRDVNYVQCTSSLKNIVVEAANDVTAPVLDCPVSTEVELDICDNVVLTAELLNVTATDNCVANPVLSLSQNNFNGTGTYNIDVFATDGVNQSQCTVEVTLVTNEAKLFLQAFDNPLGTYPFNTSVVISSAELLANDILINGINMQITGMVVDNLSHGTIVNNNYGTYTFTPNSTYSGPVSLTYAVSSDACTPAISATALATFDILPAPSNVEILDGIDNNGNGIIDEGLDCDPTLVAHWTFEPGNELTDLTGNFPDLTLNGATVSNGKLDVGIQQYATTSNFAGPSLTNKTLVAWVSLDQLNNGSIGGSALTIDKVNVDRFDGIGFSEGGLNKWQLASNYYKRTQSLTPGFSETTPNQMVRIVITYQAGINNQAFVRMYRDNVLIGEYIKGTMETFDTGANTEIFFGLRHQFPGGRLPGKPWLDAKIEEARIYDGCMTFAEIQTLSPVISGANLTVTPSDTLVCPGESVTLSVSGCTTGTATWSYSGTSNTGTSITVVPSVTTTYQVNCSSGGSTQKTISVVENTVAVVNNIDTGTETVKAVQTITSDKKVGSPSVTPKPNVNFRAGKSITLQPGFETVSSAVFKAEIKTCTE